ncbi:CDP-diacylglycerol--serine O-phosphatidyltransferase [Candidatus Woesearchaeota archaeon]|nr:CDP-diacylglycerol--serine O-phosphatidyltransferase [Candidatus Woesearchaeota archaeon]
MKIKVADYITLLNLVAGLLAIFYAFFGDFIFASLLIIFGVLLDKADGSVARLLKQESELGIQLDSFADLITFGVAPAALIVNVFDIFWLSALSLLLPIAGALRLAKFNISKKKDDKYFVGTPITLNGIFFPFAYLFGANQTFFAILIVLMSFLMISNIKIKKVFK